MGVEDMNNAKKKLRAKLKAGVITQDDFKNSLHELQEERRELRKTDDGNAAVSCDESVVLTDEWLAEHVTIVNAEMPSEGGQRPIDSSPWPNSRIDRTTPGGFHLSECACGWCNVETKIGACPFIMNSVFSIEEVTLVCPSADKQC